ncbi:MAG: Asp-tRNA(Asn)/Glu-tRNA(Gln) amidotransferase subunit GatA [Nitrosopumilus sp.]|nr:Asp-tRNA(Asn)/Glu-tRNA(Gln) amidotransferase subunit GatA [Nitrosopumilus sp.]CAI9831307.1 Glutamyl-tRNA(Gln) amidotransferase subunit A [Nitrosopumilaceae archaeon]MDA7940953.1 Asp-tRNA(Asn)/Glu-tRNA(Gln) amidotransferase subunit GatA [Nitrosopumilus sp.]MDA7943191.1 Asp-tRNA(Asn)/Glu-tRNA(Gln) amidotransferase subunit GatA [Nitrosopumilus sp.]MDA7944316.1 Asp-tRNA(Asn)/Glu-tRNA(Gln) amidotransferase subunit GatA [Nitrosopumilus sp.]
MTDIGISALEYVEGFRSGSISAEDFVAATLERIRGIDGDLHALVAVREEALDEARRVDKVARSGGDPGPCCGMPVTLKDNICTADTPTTCCSRMLEGYVPPYEATVSARLRGAGAVLVGKTNMDEFAMGLTTEFSAFGPTRNPWGTDLVPGGSSGGSAAAVAACECSASLGSDTGGSVRNPASFCSVVGFKPTYGLLSRHGLISYANSIEQAGPLTRTVRDAALMLDVVAGPDPMDPTTVGPCGPYLAGTEAGIEGRRVGIIREMVGDGVDGAVASAARDAASRLEGLGASCSEVSIEAARYSVAAYYVITSTEAGSNLARFDGLRYGAAREGSGLAYPDYLEEARSLLGPEVARRMVLGALVPSAGHAGRYFLKAQKARGALTREVAAAFKEFDFLLSPTVPVLPFELGSRIDDPVSLFLVDANTVAANLTGRPAVSVPYDIRDGRPVGVQLMADSMRDADLLAAARALEGVSRVEGGPP